MRYSVLLIHVIALICSTQSVVLRTSMTNRYPQVVVLGCDSVKANLYYDAQEEVWKEDRMSPCVNNEENILKFCQQTYPSLEIGNIVLLDTTLRFDNWCELISSTSDANPRCRTTPQAEESVRPFRCLHQNSAQEESLVSSPDCLRRNIGGPSRCLRAEKWEQMASMDCSNRTMILSSSLKTLSWCGLGEFRGVEFSCCPLKDNEASQVDGQDGDRLAEDDPISELLILPKNETVETHQRILAMSQPSSSVEPNWIQDYQQWNSDTSTFADDEDVYDDGAGSKVSLKRKSHLTINEHERFTKEKQTFKRNYQQQIEKLKSRRQQRQAEIQILANRNPSEAQTSYERVELDFRQEYEFLKQTANRERTRINELHENNLDRALDVAKSETNEKLITAWNDKPFKTEKIQEAIYNYLHVLLQDRIHLVNRYERLRVVDPEQAGRKRVSIHERLRLIDTQINQTLGQLAQFTTLQEKILPRINSLTSEYEEVNEAARRLLIDYDASLIATNKKSPRFPLGRDENKIDPLPKPVSSESNETEYDSDDDRGPDENEDDDDEPDKKNPIGNREFYKDEPSDVRTSDEKSSIRSDSAPSQSLFNDARPLIPRDRKSNRLLSEYLLYLIGCLSLLCLIIGIFVVRRLRDQRRQSSRLGKYEKTKACTGVDSCTQEEKALHALQTNGYENPTYKFFETQTLKC